MNRFGWISMLVGFVFGLLLWTAPPVWAAAVCIPKILATTPTEEFTLNDSNGTATHLKTGLIWMRCALGQSWISTSTPSTLKLCTGNPTAYTWGAALRAARGYSFAGYSDWRLPNAKELATIIEERCYGPSLNETVFPGASSYWYWSSSTDADHPDFAWGVHFNLGLTNAAGNKSNDGHARLVRGGQWFGDYVGGGGQTYLLTVTKAGTGTGTVTGTGINCGSDCTESYASGTNVPLTATPASGSTFAGWSGACSGTGACTVTMSAVKSVTATFNLLNAATLRINDVSKAEGSAGTTAFTFTVTLSPASTGTVTVN